MKKLPTGIQTFEKIINENRLYVDKTKYLYDLITTDSIYFLSRPRRFGKSLTVSTLEAIFLGKKELFKGLYIYDADYDWKPYPVIRIDMSAVGKRTDEKIHSFTIEILADIAKSYKVTIDSNCTAEIYFKRLILALREKYNEKVVILIDEYDKPILDFIAKDIEKTEKNREFLKEFYNIIKVQDNNIKFVFVTGVTKFSKLSIFSGFNNIRDITMSPDYAAMCGYTQEELETNFKEYIDRFVSEHPLKLTKQETLERFKYRYNGFRFSKVDVTVYNPYSTLLILADRDYGNYWVQTGSPEFLIELIKQNKYKKILELDGSIAYESTFESAFSSFEIQKMDILPLFIQTGYMTIKNYDAKEEEEYRIGFPNKEVERAFSTQIIAALQNKQTGDIERDVDKLENAFKQGSVSDIFMLLRSYVSSTPYWLKPEKEEEKFYQGVIYLLLKGLRTGVGIIEEPTNIGRMDLIVELTDKIYIMEFKIKGTKEDALNQIIEKKYYEKYLIKQKEIRLIGILIDVAQRNMSEYVACKIDITKDNKISFVDKETGAADL